MARSLVERLAALRARLAARSDTEHEQAIVRLLNTLAFGLYLLPDFTQHALLWLIYRAGRGVRATLPGVD